MLYNDHKMPANALLVTPLLVIPLTPLSDLRGSGLQLTLVET